MLRIIVGVVLLATLVLERLLYRDDYRQARTARSHWRVTADALDPDDRRELNRAVWRGQAVADSRLAPAAVDLATAVIGRPSNLLRRVNVLLGLVWFSVPVMWAIQDSRWALVLGLSLIPLVFVIATIFIARLQRRVRQALDRNRALLDRPPPPPISAL
ncbi:MAG: hypothetical protein ACLGI2_04300 [Acidimicrobiia bacterium]